MSRTRLPARAADALAVVPLLWLAHAAASEPSRSLIDRLLGLTRLSWSDPQTMLGWRFELPALLWLLIAAGAAAVGLASYARLMGARPARMALASVRAVLVLVVAVLLAGPTLVLHDEQVEPDWLIMLVDRSASMQVRDTPDPDSDDPQAGLSRDEVLRRGLAAQQHLFNSDSPLARQRRIVWLGFGGEVYDLPSPTDAPDLNWPDAMESQTLIRTAIEQALARAVGRPISGIVLFSDGRSPETTGAELVQRLEQQAVSVFSVPLGADPMPLELAIGTVQAPQQAFAGDIVPVSISIDQYGGEHPLDLAHVHVRLVNEADGQILDQQPLEGTGFGRPLRLQAREPEPGAARWRAEVAYENPHETSALRELTTDNNQRSIQVQIIDRPLRVLYIEGYPRWEYRYLKAMLLREDSIASSMYLLSADRAFAQEGDIPIARLPRTAEEFADYDVIIIGDVHSGSFTDEQITLLRDHVATRHAGLLWIGGERHTPASYEETPLRELLPMRQPAAVGRLRGMAAGIELAPTQLAEQLSVLVLRSRAGEAEQSRAVESAAWPEQLPPLRWAQGLGRLKPTAEVLALGRVPQSASEPQPLLVRLRYGAGQSIYLATDETWRWRYGQGDLYFQQFWIQVIRLLGRERTQQSADHVQLHVSHRRADVGDTLVVELIVQDPAMLQRELAEVAVNVHQRGSAGDGLMIERIQLRPTAPDDPQSADEAGIADTQRVYRAQWQPSVAGDLDLRVAEPALAGLDLAQQVQVIASDDEMRRPQPDHDRLAALAEQTGGSVVPIDQLDELAELVPNRAIRTPNDVREPIGNSSVALLLVLGLLTAEWVGRKMIRLV